MEPHVQSTHLTVTGLQPGPLRFLYHTVASCWTQTSEWSDAVDQRIKYLISLLPSAEIMWSPLDRLEYKSKIQPLLGPNKLSLKN